ncbi:MAG: ammonium transporter [Caulobacteraceae bacterium]|nr:ammonium transporter [Caulobacteraceae bacterium]
MTKSKGLWRSLRIAALALVGAVALGAMAPELAFAQETSAAVETVVADEGTGEILAVEEAAPEAPALTVDKGDTGWMLVSTVLVLLMIIPGLALFYGGLVRAKNMVSILSQVFVVTGIGMVMWLLVGYSLAFTDGGGLNRFVGGLDKAFLNGVNVNTLVETFSVGIAIPELIFVAFQMTFACITAALVLGGVAERVKFSTIVIFSILWPVIVYYPMAHMVWWWGGPIMASDPANADALAAGAGLIWNFGALDFAGGTVVHINSGVAALVGALLLGSRTGYRKEPMPPHNLTFTVISAGLLWVGWIGFNAGSNLESNAYAALALINTFVAPAGAALSWTLTEWLTKGKPSLLGLASGAVAGLVAVTPAAGFAGPVGALILGLVVGPICLFACSALKSWLKYDDSLDVFGIHGIGGIVGAIGTGIVVNPDFGGAGIVNYVTGAAEYPGIVAQVTKQALGVAVTLAWSGVGSLIVWVIARGLTGGRVSKEVESEGVDYAEHGEVAYHN